MFQNKMLRKGVRIYFLEVGLLILKMQILVGVIKEAMVSIANTASMVRGDY
jgi:hypothetical protein